ncbi:GNAT family N-acetyltransferase [Motilimonas cestriensis]|uniref:GNAT family N-acetyltransferase n=1 Tax=Motilimonas cestriensis TaxID=2742685 RepID=A0ABS8W9M1_9GAMM|nr:GNAT family N-acetyltransferase [Motilimonas cestriensis]MCE2595052.1 GNAT family N-acetyltransferase [Motilimonas cestriensis]
MNKGLSHEIKWQLSHFTQLTATQWYQIAALRMAIFVVEQDCPYQDLDGLDCHPDTLHLSAWQGDEVVGYLRILPPHTAYPQASIGRVIVAMPARSIGLGHQLMARGVTAAKAHFNLPFYLSAQTHLQGFYLQHGFQIVGEPYLEDGIPHIGMMLD